MEEILHQLIGDLSWSIPLFIRFQPSVQGAGFLLYTVCSMIFDYPLDIPLHPIVGARCSHHFPITVPWFKGVSNDLRPLKNDPPHIIFSSFSHKETIYSLYIYIYRGCHYRGHQSCSYSSKFRPVSYKNVVNFRKTLQKMSQSGKVPLQKYI